MTNSAEQLRRIKAIWNEHLQVSRGLARLSGGAVLEAVNIIYSSLANGGKLFIAGNGGSAADAQHIAAELTGRFLRDRSGSASNSAPCKYIIAHCHRERLRI